MKIVCSWCKKEIGEKEPLDDKSVTHSICKDCDQQVRKESGMPESTKEDVSKGDIPANHKPKNK